MPRLSRRTCLKAASCATALSFFGAARAAENANAKLLTVYFSWSGSSKTVAEKVRRLAGGDILRLETVEPYPAEYRATTERAKKEREANARPPLKTALPDLSAYGTIVLAHPIWGGHMPMPVRTFLDAVDLSGKRVAHVTTHGGSGLGQSHGERAQIEPKAVLLDPHDVYGWHGVRDLESVGVWLSRIGLVECAIRLSRRYRSRSSPPFTRGHVGRQVQAPEIGRTNRPKGLSGASCRSSNVLRRCGCGAERTDFGCSSASPES